MPETYSLRATLSLNDLPAAKQGTRVAGIVIVSPVLGLRPGAGLAFARLKGAKADKCYLVATIDCCHDFFYHCRNGSISFFITDTDFLLDRLN